MARDLTSFWLAWRKTCAIRTCCSEASLSLHNRQCKTASDRIAEPEMKKVSEDAKWVMEVTNGYFAKMIRTPRSVKALKKATKIKTEKEVYAALGWLAKEGKLSFAEQNADVYVSLL